MGGYARYVWPCYLLALIVLAGNVWFAIRRHAVARERALRRVAVAETTAQPTTDGISPEAT